MNLVNLLKELFSKNSTEKTNFFDHKLVIKNIKI